VACQPVPNSRHPEDRFPFNIPGSLDPEGGQRGFPRGANALDLVVANELLLEEQVELDLPGPPLQVLPLRVVLASELLVALLEPAQVLLLVVELGPDSSCGHLQVQLCRLQFRLGLLECVASPCRFRLQRCGDLLPGTHLLLILPARLLLLRRDLPLPRLP